MIASNPIVPTLFARLGIPQDYIDIGVVCLLAAGLTVVSLALFGTTGIFVYATAEPLLRLFQLPRLVFNDNAWGTMIIISALWPSTMVPSYIIGFQKFRHLTESLQSLIFFFCWWFSGVLITAALMLMR